MELIELFNDITPEELEPRLELQILADPLFSTATNDNNNNCKVVGACNIKLS